MGCVEVPGAEREDAARGEDQQEWQCFKKVARAEIDAVIEIAGISADDERGGDEHKPVGGSGAEGQERDSDKGQGKVEGPAEEVDSQDSEQLVEVDQSRRKRVLTIKAYSLTEAPAVAREEEDARCDPGIAGEQAIEAQTEADEDERDGDEGDTWSDPALPILAYLAPAE